MVDWLASMQQTYEYYIVDPRTWEDRDRLTNVTGCRIERDQEAETLGSATIDMTELVGEAYVRVYLVTIQNGVRDRTALGTFLIQTPTSTFDGKVRESSVDAYTPLLELKETLPPIGYALPKGTNIMTKAHELTTNNCRAQVSAVSIRNEDDPTEDVLQGDFVANTDDTWLRFLKDLIANAKYSFALDEMGRILFAPDQDTASLQPVWTYTDDNSSILLPSMSMTHDLYGVPNVVEVTYSDQFGCTSKKCVNEDKGSPTSTVNRGREIVYRVEYPSQMGHPSERQLTLYAEQLLEELSSIDYTITYTHGYCPVRLGDCVRLNYTRAGLENVKARVVSQSIECVPGCQVTETAVFTKKLWRDA
jgi:hypothetical protein